MPAKKKSKKKSSSSVEDPVVDDAPVDKDPKQAKTTATKKKKKKKTTTEKGNDAAPKSQKKSTTKSEGGKGNKSKGAKEPQDSSDSKKASKKKQSSKGKGDASKDKGAGKAKGKPKSSSSETKASDKPKKSKKKATKKKNDSPPPSKDSVEDAEEVENDHQEDSADSSPVDDSSSVDDGDDAPSSTSSDDESSSNSGVVDDAASSDGDDSSTNDDEDDSSDEDSSDEDDVAISFRGKRQRPGQLYVVLHEAKDLPKRNIFTKGSDPYIRVNVSKAETKKETKKNAIYKSKVLKKSVAPSWNEGSKLLPIASDDVSISISLWNANKRRSDDFLGMVRFAVDELNDGKPRESWHALQSREGKKDKVGGEVHLQIMFVDEGENVSGDEFSYSLQSFLRKGRVDVVNLLLKDGLDPNEVDEPSKVSPLDVACMKNLPQAARLLLKHGADVNQRHAVDGRTPLHRACESSWACARMIIDKKGCDVGVADAHGSEPMHVAARHNNAMAINYLASKGAELHATDEDGNTPLHVAVAHKAHSSLTALIELGADIYARNGAGMTVGELSADVDEECKMMFMSAVGVEDFQEVELLEAWKSKMRAQSDALSTVWSDCPQFAIRSSAKQKVRVLVHHKGEPDNGRLGFLVVRSMEARYRVHSYVADHVGQHGTGKPLEVELDPEEGTAVVIPYARSEDLSSTVVCLVFAKEDGPAPVTLEQLEPWPFKATVSGEWKGKHAGGCQNHDTWHLNPRFNLVLRKKEKVNLSIMLSQSSADQGLGTAMGASKYRIEPTEFHVGFYIFDEDVGEVLDQCRKFRNAEDVVYDCTLDGKKRKTYVILPCTFKPDQETSFKLTVLSDKAIKLRKPK